MNTFVCQHAENIHGVLCGFDRVRFRGSVRSISYAKGFLKYLCFINVLLKFAADFFNGTSRRLRSATERLAQNTPAGKVVYLAGNHDKQEVVDALMKEHGVADDFVGLIAVLSCVENCRSFEVHKTPTRDCCSFVPRLASVCTTICTFAIRGSGGCMFGS